jgi:hypothetical protein
MTERLLMSELPKSVRYMLDDYYDVEASLANSLADRDDCQRKLRQLHLLVQRIDWITTGRRPPDDYVEQVGQHADYVAAKAHLDAARDDYLARVFGSEG